MSLLILLTLVNLPGGEGREVDLTEEVVAYLADHEELAALGDSFVATHVESLSVGAVSIKKKAAVREDDWGQARLVSYEPAEDDEADEADEADKADTGRFDFLEVYPQPAHDILFVGVAYSFGEPVTIELFDVLGLSVHKEVLDGPRLAIDVSDLPRGVYFLAADKDDQPKVMRRIIIY